MGECQQTADASHKPGRIETLISDETRMDKHSSLIKASKQLIVAVISALAVATSEYAQGQSNERSGKDVVEAVCFACHRTGARGAPMIGDKKAWSKLNSKGLTGLTQVALKGIRQMPPHGGNVVIGGQELSKTMKGLLTYQPIYLGREGVVTSLLLLAGPFVALWVMARLLPPWEESPEASHA